ncbi:MAG TPA: tail fiber protein [Acidobacteriaceae bacterium]|nr:tail fiber protein [Acidobacteriaceae bacterium]
MGMIFPWAMNWAPVNFMLCQGQTLPISSYNALFALLGTTYGGNGTTNFMLPNLQGVFPLGMGTNTKTGQTYVEGNVGGVTQVTLTQAEMPAHTHAATFAGTGGGGGGTPTVTVTMQGSSATGTSSAPAGNYLAGAGSAVGSPAKSPNLYVPAASAAGTLGNLAGASATITGGGGGITGGTVTNALTGGGQPVATMPPYLVLNYIICVNGLFPSRQ